MRTTPPRIAPILTNGLVPPDGGLVVGVVLVGVGTVPPRDTIELLQLYIHVPDVVCVDVLTKRVELVVMETVVCAVVCIFEVVVEEITTEGASGLTTKRCEI